MTMETTRTIRATYRVNSTLNTPQEEDTVGLQNVVMYRLRVQKVVGSNTELETVNANKFAWYSSASTLKCRDNTSN
jgi:hypothetical protein